MLDENFLLAIKEQVNSMCIEVSNQAYLTLGAYLKNIDKNEIYPHILFLDPNAFE